jgi:lipopolysaccharide transport system permease protein
LLTAPGRPGDSVTTTVIKPARGWIPLDFQELWSYRELLFFFVWRDLKVRYKQTAFGALWAIIQPTLLMIVFTLFLSRLSGIAPAGVPYPVFAFAALVPWTLFAQSLIGSSDSLVEASNLLQKVYFPRILLPAAAVASYLLDFVIAMAVLAVLLVVYGVIPTINVVWVVPLTALALAVAFAVGTWLSAINVRYRDVRYAVPFLVQLWLLASPVAYSLELVPPEWRAVYQLNPMVGVVEGFRWALLGYGDPPVGPIVASVVVTVIAVTTGVAYFRSVERTFADVI